MQRQYQVAHASSQLPLILSLPLTLSTPELHTKTASPSIRQLLLKLCIRHLIPITRLKPLKPLAKLNNERAPQSVAIRAATVQVFRAYQALAAPSLCACEEDNDIYDSLAVCASV